MAQKIFGWILIIASIIAICWGVYSSYKIFTGQKQSPQIFAVPNQSVSSAQANSLDAQFQKIIGDQVKNLIPINSISTLFNLVVWSMFMGILFWASGQVAGIGIKLLSAGCKPESN